MLAAWFSNASQPEDEPQVEPSEGLCDRASSYLGWMPLGPGVTMEEKHKLLYEKLGYTGPLETRSETLGAAVVADESLTPDAVEDYAGPPIDEAVVVLPGDTLPGEDPAEIPPLGPEGVAQLEESLNRNPEETLIRAREAFDEDISETELRAMIAQARMALDSPETAIASLEMDSLHLEAANPLPPDFSFDGMDLNEIPIKPGDTKFETVADAIGWALFAGPFVLTHGSRDKFRWHSSPSHVTSRFSYPLAEPSAAAPLEIALFSDFGTWRYYSRYIAKRLRTRKFPYAIHLGDVYYAGRRSEFEKYFEAPLDPILADTTLFALNSNHEMYSAGIPYYEFMDKRRAKHPSKQLQEGSYFCLRSEKFQVVGIDTAYFDRGRYNELELLDWLTNILREGRNAGRANILLSADQPYGYGSSDQAKLLSQDLAHLVKDEQLIDLWFWGNTHYCALFDKAPTSPFVGSCIGHAGYPYDRQSVGKSTPAPLLFLETSSRFPKWTKLRQDRGNNGYCIMSLKSDGSVGLQYEDWMAQRRCEASLTRTATGKLQVSSVVPVP
jgi:hypothetical protein